MDVEQLLAELGSQPATFGWDVVCAIQADLLSDLLARSYVIQQEESDTQSSVSGSVDAGNGVTIQFSGLTLGEPLISISPNLEPQQLGLTMRIVKGLVSVVRSANGISFVTSQQVISTADGYTLQGVVSLQILQGTVQGGQNVTVTITDPSTFAADLSLNVQGAGTLLGQYLATWISQQSSLVFALGTIIAGSNANLVPVKFQLSTQIDPDDPGDPGRLLLFIATEYNPSGGTQTSLALNNVVPDGWTSTTIIAPGAFLQQILTATLAANCLSQQLPVQIKSAPYQVYFEGGTLNLGSIEFIDHANRHVFSWKLEPNPGFSDNGTGDPMYIPLGAGWMEPAMVVLQPGLVFQWIPVWTQGFYILEEQKGATCEVTFYWKTSAPDGAGFLPASVNPATNTVSFGSPPSPVVEISKISNSNVIGHDETHDLLTVLPGAVAQHLAAQLPAIDAESVTNLVLPGQTNLTFDQVYFTGSQDMILFGNVQSYGVTVSPVTVDLKPSQMQQFTATLPAGDTEGVTWSCRYGQISQGLYTAPARLPGEAMDVVVAARNSNPSMIAAAFVSLVPADVNLSPDCAVAWPGCDPISFAAPGAAEGPTPEFMLNPSTGCGTIDANGNYSAPSSVTDIQKVVVTATASGQAIGESFLVLLPEEPSAIEVSPMSIVVEADGTQSFAVSGAQVTWSVFWLESNPDNTPKITPEGLFTAPVVSQPTCAVVVASEKNGAGYGVGVALITPAD